MGKLSFLIKGRQGNTMTLTVTGKVSFSSTTCEKCGEVISLWSCPKHSIKCAACGAVYSVKSAVYDDQCVNVECEFVEFQCIQTGLTNACSNVCPAAGMYCKTHLTDECYQSVKGSIGFYEDIIAKSKAQLNRMDEAKKVWLIEELGGLDEQ